ncbi:MAG: hypothetical protein ACOCWB_08855 [Bacteroidota bacterium]
MNKKKLFLLGGKDLEMVTIQNILNSKQTECLPKKEEELPKWGASIDMYKHILDDEKYKSYDIYAVELTEPPGWKKPDNLTIIDHHGEKEKSLSSLEQVAVKIGHTLSDQEKLIAVNDKSYITGMIEFGATMEEIYDIRRKDRAAQGVTADDEKKAQDSIKLKINNDDVIVVKSSTQRFSAITDRLYPYSKLLIYTNNEIVYYGINKNKLVSKFDKEISDKLVYHGGGDNGFIGFTSTFLEKNDITESINKIISVVKEKKRKIYSKHLFLFPFTWSIQKASNDFDQKTDLSKIYNVFQEKKEWSNMQDSPPTKEDIVREYNIKAYFYKFAQSAIFNRKEDEVEEIKKNCDVLTYDYKLDIEKENTYTIQLLPKPDDEPLKYILEVL